MELNKREVQELIDLIADVTDGADTTDLKKWGFAKLQEKGVATAKEGDTLPEDFDGVIIPARIGCTC